MRLHCLIAFVFVVGAAAPAWAESASPQSGNCGATVEDNLAAARQALPSNDAALRASLACLIAATASLNDRLRALEAGGKPTGLLHVPSRDIVNLRQPGQ